jgi:hypothetical protein
MKVTINEILAISSGTISTLTGYKEYIKIDDIQKKFVQFCIGVLDSSPNEFDNWKEAWMRFDKVYNISENSKFSDWCENPKELKPI